jgi:uncharacterized protein DUF6263
MTPILSIRRAVILLALLAVTTPAFAQSATLRYRWTKGDTLTYRIELRTSSLVTGMPGMPEVKIDQGLTQTVKIAALDVAADGTATLRETFESMKMEMDGPMGHISYDTAAPGSTANPMVQALRQTLDAIVGGAITIEQSSDGTIQKVDGAATILERITKNTLNDPAATMAAQGLKAAFSDEALKTTIQQSYPKLPANAVKPGDTWPGQTAMGNEVIGRIVGDVKFTVKAVEGSADAGLVRVDVALVLKQEITPPPGPNGMTMKLGDAKGTGEIVFDVAKGRIRDNSMKTEMPSTVTMQAPDGSTATMQNRTTTTVKMTLVEK